MIYRFVLCDQFFVFSFHWGHIWSCPPSEGDDYIFHCHPPEQKIPKHKRLVEWYKKMLDKSKVDNVIMEYKVTSEVCFTP